MLSVRFAGYYEQDAFARLRRNYRGCKNTPKWCVAVDSRTQTAMQESLAMNTFAYDTRHVFHNAGHGLWQRLVALSCYASVPAGSSVTVMRSYPGNIEMWRREMTSVLDNFNFVMPSSTNQFKCESAKWLIKCQIWLSVLHIDDISRRWHQDEWWKKKKSSSRGVAWWCHRSQNFFAKLWPHNVRRHNVVWWYRHIALQLGQRLPDHRCYAKPGELPLILEALQNYIRCRELSKNGGAASIHSKLIITKLHLTLK